MGKIITVAIEKGGVGKSTTAINLAALYGEHDKTVLCLDIDPQGNLTKTLSGGKPKEFFDTKGIFDMFMSFGYTKASDFVAKTVLKNVDMIPSNSTTGQIINILPILKSKYHKAEYVYLAACVSDVVNKYDVIIVDTPSAKDLLVSSALYCANEVIIPVCADGYSLDGMTSIYALINKLKTDENIDINILGILMTKMEKTSSANYMRAMLQESDFSEDLFSTEIRKSVAVSDSTILSMPVVLSDRNSNSALDYIKLYNEITTKIDGRNKEYGKK